MKRPVPWPASALRDRLRTIAATLGDIRTRVAKTQDEAQYMHARTMERLDWFEKRFDSVDTAIAGLRSPDPVDLDPVMEALRAVADDESRARSELFRLRASREYTAAFEEEEPLVSVVIPTYDNHGLLRDRALPSVLAQTYENLEVIVVGDAAPDAARRAVEDFGDPRLHFHNLPTRGPYPDDAEARWLVAGVPPYNEGVRLATGRWIAPLDDDDAFHADHVEHLVSFARERRAELAYGQFRSHRPNGGVHARIGSFPPAHGAFNLQASVYHAGLADIFQLELSDAVWGVPYDWSLCRRMLRAGVRMAMLEEEVVHYYPGRLWRSGDEPLDAERQIAPEGWDAARAKERETGQGWAVDAVADAYVRKWPEFLAAVDGPGPLGVNHEVPEGIEMPRDDPSSQNTVLAFGNVLAQAAGVGRQLSVLDWGGALGHYHVLAKKLLDGIELDYHVYELPAVSERGREVSPEVTFHDDESCLERRYDLVMASGALQYADDWPGMLRRLAGAAERWLFVTRVPVVLRHPAFVERQRAHAYGYETAYVGWVFNRDELVGKAGDAGFELVREYALHPPMPVVGAPEDPVHVGLAFRRRDAS